MTDLAHVPHNLRRYVVEQDYSQYTEIDQAVWRFVLLQTYERLQHTAHPAYRSGLGKTGISVERIPRIAEISERLERFGWGAVCVDGFIPPRAFQEFQAAGILPIAADMRTKDHLVYTPAPDIIHESDGSVVLRGSVSLSRVQALFGVEWDVSGEESATTIGGLLNHIAGHVPIAGEHLDYGGLRFEVLEANQRKVLRLRVRPRTVTVPAP